MEETNLSRFKSHCAYCWRYLDSRLVVCTCHISLCDDHQKIHMYRKGHDPVFYVSLADDGVFVYSEKLRGHVCKELQKRINEKLWKIDQDDMQYHCPHFENEKKNEKKDEETGGRAEKFKIEKRCTDCDVENNLWACFTCGNVGCGRDQYEVKGNSHAIAHFKETKHPIVVKLGTVKSDGSNESFCYKCDAFVVNERVRDKLPVDDDFVAAEPPTKVESTITEESQTTNVISSLGTTLISSPAFIGIRNLGNTCFISSVLQLLARVVKTDYLDQHFVSCKENPLDCITCQTIRVILSINGKKPVVIEDLVSLVYKEFPQFVPKEQQDASEFLLFFLNRLEPVFFEPLKFEILTHFSCQNCKAERDSIEETLLLNIPLRASLSESIKAYFSPARFDCPCGSEGISISRMRILPEFLILVLNRWDLHGNKRSDPIMCDDISELPLSETAVSKEGITSLSPLGFVEESMHDALVLANNDIEKASNLLLGKKLMLRKNPEFKFLSAICHRGASVSNGHYTFIFNENGFLVHVDDENVGGGTDEELSAAYILCYE